MINGVPRPHKRKHCLACLPVGGNKQPLHKRNLAVDSGHKVVCGCGRVYIYVKSRGHTKTHCNSCAVNSRRFAVKKRAVAYKGGSCKRCGYSKCLNALQFHHTDPSQKDFSFSSNHSRSWARIQAELDKCVLLCSNCHVEVHAEIDAVNNSNARHAQEEIQRLADARPRFVPNACVVCGKRTGRCNKTCWDCRPSVFKITWPSTAELEVLVTEGSFEAAARQLEISGNAIRKRLKKAGIVIRKYKPRAKAVADEGSNPS